MRNRAVEAISEKSLLAFVTAALLMLGFIALPTAAIRASADPGRAETTASVTAVATGNDHSCSLVSDGTVKCWGKNNFGQLGDGATTDRWLPTTVTKVSGAIAVATGMYHTCALISGGTVQCWGANPRGELGDGSPDELPAEPGIVAGLSGVTAITAGYDHTCALTSSGTVHCWGNNEYGKLGDGTTTNRRTPVSVTGIAGAAAVSAGFQHTCALMPGGAAKCWGNNAHGQLGDSTNFDRPQPGPVTDLVGATTIASGYLHTCALMSGGTVRCWGGSDQMGISPSDGIGDSSIPVTVNGLSGVTSLTVGAASGYTCAVMSVGAPQCWGHNGYLQLGRDWSSNPYTPFPVSEKSGLTSAVALAAGFAHTCALLRGGVVQCWGYNAYGQLGNGTNVNSRFAEDQVEPTTSPTAVPTTTPGQHQSKCDDTYFLAVRGSGESVPNNKSLEHYEDSLGDPVYKKTSGINADTTGMGDPVTGVFREFHEQWSRHQSRPVQARAIAYPAIAVGDGGAQYINRYQRSVRVGADQLNIELNLIREACSEAEVVIAGYSQGADVINKSMGDAHRSSNKSLFGQVKKIVVLGDPSHLPNRIENIGNWWKLGSTNGSGASVAAFVADLDSYKFKDDNRGKVASLCLISDLVCDTSSLDASEAIASAFGPQTHTLYNALSMQCPVVNNAWQYPTDCGAQILAAGIGLTPVARSRGGLHADQIIAQSGKSIWATAVAIKASAIGNLGRITKLFAIFRSTPIDVGTFDVNEDGTAIINFVVPDVPPGLHHLELTADDGTSYRIPIYVAPDSIDDRPVAFVIDGSNPTTTQSPETPEQGTDTGSFGSGSVHLPFGS